MRASPKLPISLFALVTAACSGSAPAEDLPEHTSSTSNAIVGGTPDTTHQAVVEIYSPIAGGGLQTCTGTIFKTDPANGIGWVLTAAHCVTVAPTTVVQGNDDSKPDRSYRVVDYKPDPSFDAKNPSSASNFGHDLAVLRITDVDDTTPVIPMTSDPDGIADTGTTPLLSIGYGLTVAPIPGEVAAGASIRHQATLLFAPIPGYGEISFNPEPPDNATFCYGDSGGPDLLTTGGVERVVGVHSLGDCVGGGFSARVSYGLDFIKGQLPPDSPAEDAGATDSGANSNATDGIDSSAGNDPADLGATNNDTSTTDSAVAGSGVLGCSASAIPPSSASHGALLALGAMALTLARLRR
ncbi:MAG: S1 family peptidase [Polyangiaceae bacterium]|nr:S1 family peptidase [Polyangiaceae bacterium]